MAAQNYPEARAPVHVDVVLRLSKNAIGSELNGGEFQFAVYNEFSQEVAHGTNDSNGLIEFTPIVFTLPGEFDYTVREIAAPPGWLVDDTIYPVHITDTAVYPDLIATVTYPDGAPGFKNTRESETCGLIEFEDLTFDTAGDYRFFLRELTPSGGGWETDPGTVEVIVHVIDDGYGNLIATVEYPDGFPMFINRYEARPVSVVISACKIAVGAPLPAHRFEFGLFDQAGGLIATATNGPAQESI